MIRAGVFEDFASVCPPTTFSAEFFDAFERALSIAGSVEEEHGWEFSADLSDGVCFAGGF